MVDLINKISAIVGEDATSVLNDDNKRLMDFWVSLDGLRESDDGMAPSQKFENGRLIVQKTLSTIYYYVEVFRAKVFKTKYGKSTFVESKIQRETKKKLAERAKLRRRNK